jgi:hypothetical protein
VRRVIGRKSTEDHGARLLELLLCGIVNLARHCLCRKVATKARIAVGSFPVAREQQLAGTDFHEL